MIGAGVLFAALGGAIPYALVSGLLVAAFAFAAGLGGRAAMNLFLASALLWLPVGIGAARRSIRSFTDDELAGAERP
jgi:hypothetical protein